MKKNYPLFFMITAVTLLASGCSKGDEVSASAGSISTSGEVNSASISGVTSGSVDSLAFWLETSSYNEMIIGHTKVHSGSFSIKLDTIATKYLFKVKNAEIYGTDEDTTSVKIEYSNSSAYISDGEGIFIDAYNYGKYTGSVARTNCTLDQYKSNTAEKGLAMAIYIYCNTKLTITGSSSYTDNEYNTSFKYNYNVSFQKGWNEMIVQIASANSTSTTVSISANNEPSGMKWLFIPNDEEYSKQMNIVSKAKSNLLKKITSKISLR